MNKYFLLFIQVLFFLPFLANAQNTDKISVNFGGYVHYTAIFDSRQVVAAREGHFFLYPKKEVLNAAGDDINAVSNFNMAVIQTRLNSKITGPSILGAKITGFVEAEFMGNTDSDVNGVRIRHAYIDFKWDNWSILLGQYWNPLFVVDNYPDQLGSNGGAPIQAFGRNPQIKFTYFTDNTKTSLTIASQRDYASTGEKGYSSEYLRNAIIPDLYLTTQFKVGEQLFGIGGELKQLRPFMVSDLNYVNENKVTSYAVSGFAKFKVDNFTAKLEGLYGANLSDLTMLGGYAVKSIDPNTHVQEYTPTKVYSIWAELVYGKQFELGLFAGYTKNLGTDDKIVGAIYARGSDIDNVYRIAPRFYYKVENLKVGFEVEYTSAGYGMPDQFAKVSNVKNIGNFRVFTAFFYSFSL